MPETPVETFVRNIRRLTDDPELLARADDLLLADRARPDAVKAADLPVGSIVATDDLVGIKHDTQPRYGNPWRMTNGGHYHDTHIDELLADGAAILRSGIA